MNRFLSAAWVAGAITVPSMADASVGTTRPAVSAGAVHMELAQRAEPGARLPERGSSAMIYGGTSADRYGGSSVDRTGVAGRRDPRVYNPPSRQRNENARPRKEEVPQDERDTDNPLED